MKSMYFSTLLFLGATALALSSCSSKSKDEPQKPPTVVPQPTPGEPKLLDQLKGTWLLSNVVVSPEEVVVDGKKLKVADHIFHLPLLGGIATPGQVVIDAKEATFTGLAEPKTAVLKMQIDAEGKLTYLAPIGKVVKTETGIQVQIQVPNALLKTFKPGAGQGGSQGNPNAPKPTLSDSEKVLQALALGTEDLKITIDGKR